MQVVGRGIRRQQRQVDFPLLKLCGEQHWLNRDHSYTNARCAHAKRGNKWHDNRFERVIRSGDGKGERCGERVKLCRFKQDIDIAEDLFDRGGQLLGTQRRNNAMRCATKQRIVKIVAQAVEHTAYRRLGERQPLRRPGYAAFIQQGIQRF